MTVYCIQCPWLIISNVFVLRVIIQILMFTNQDKREYRIDIRQATLCYHFHPVASLFLSYAEIFGHFINCSEIL